MKTRQGNEPTLIAAAVEGRPLTEIAAAAGVSISTVQRRLREPEIQAQIRAARAEMRYEATGRLATLRAKAVTRLADLIHDDDPAIAMRAITTVLSSAARLEQIYDIAVRLDELEAKVLQQASNGVRDGEAP